MTVKEFIESFVEQNTLIRLQYQTKSGHELVDSETPRMEWELKDSEYADRIVIGVTDILYPQYSEAVNLVIER